MNNVDWRRLLSLRKWCPLAEAGLQVRCISEPLFHVTEGLFVTLNEFNFAANSSSGAPFLTSLLWAQTEGAAQRVINSKIELDVEQSAALPPVELLPAEGAITYGSIAAAYERNGVGRQTMETAGYRGTDGLFVTRQITAHPFTYYFRRSEHGDSETPCAVRFSLIGK
jgi:hypothetical protein